MQASPQDCISADVEKTTCVLPSYVSCLPPPPAPCRDSILMFAQSKSPETFASSSASEIHDSGSGARVFMQNGFAEWLTRARALRNGKRER